MSLPIAILLMLREGSDAATNSSLLTEAADILIAEDDDVLVQD